MPPSTRAKTNTLARAATAAGALALLLGVAGWLGSRRFAPTSSGPAPRSSDAAARECSSNAQCLATHGGAPFVCHRDAGTCAPLESDLCRVVADPADLANEATVWVGVMLASDDRGRDAIELARRDLAQAGRSEPTHSRRPIGLVECDDNQDQAHADAEHLVRDVRVPVVIGFATSNEIFDLGPSTFFPNDVALVSDQNTSPQITRIPQGSPRLMWRLALNLAAGARVIGQFVPQVLEPLLRTAGRKTTRVAVVKMAAFPGHDAFAAALYDQVTFNGESALANGDRYRQFSDPVDTTGTPLDPNALAADLVSFGPDVIVYFGGDPFLRGVMEPVDRRLHESPIWVTPNEFQPEVYRYVGADPVRRRRFFALEVTATGVARERFVAHLHDAFPNQPIDQIPGGDAAYDALYLVAYAAYATAAGPITGSSLARAFARLVPPGKPILVGPESIGEAIAGLESGGNLDLEGASGHLDLDLATGEAPVDLAIVCLARDADGHAVRRQESGLVYDARASKLSGVMRCP